MPKIILEKGDIEKLIKDSYQGAEIIKIPAKISIEIRVDEIKARPVQVQNEVIPNTTGEKFTKPGGAMGNIRGQMPVY